MRPTKLNGNKKQTKYSLNNTKYKNIYAQNDAWLQQRYNPEVLDAIERERKQRVIKNSQEFINLFKTGFYNDIDLSVK